MKNIIIVSVFFAGVILGMYFLNPLLVDSSTNTEDYVFYSGYCNEHYEDGDWFMSSYLTEEEQESLQVKYDELLLEYEVTEEELYKDHYIMHEIMEELWEYADSEGIEYGYYGGHHMGGMFR